MTPFDYNFDIPQSNYEWDSYNMPTYSPPPQEFVYNEPCPICLSHSHFVTECPRAHEFSDFVQNYVNATPRCVNPSVDNSYSYTYHNEWETHLDSSWTQEPWVDDANTFNFSPHYMAPPEQSYQYDYPSLPQENSDFKDNMWQQLAELEIRIDRLAHTFNGQEERESSLTQMQQEQIGG